MRQLRKEDLSLFRYIKDTVLRDFVEKEEMVPLELISELSCDGGYVYEAQSDMASDRCPAGAPRPVHPGGGGDDGHEWVHRSGCSQHRSR